MALSLVFSTLAFSNTLSAEETYTEVNSTEDFIAAIDRQDPKIILNESIVITEKININYDLEIEGLVGPFGTIAGFRFEGDVEGWDRNFILHFYKSKSTLRNLNFTGGDAALLVNGSDLTLEDEISFDNHEFGAIEVSKGEGVSEKGILNLADSIRLEYYAENYDTPLVWFDSSDSVIVNEEVLTMSRDVDKGNKTQKYFYLNYQENSEEAKYSESLIKDVNDTVRKYPHMARMFREDNLVLMRYEDILDWENRTEVADFIYFIITNMNEGVEFSFTHEGVRYTRATDRKVLYKAAQEAALNYRFQGGYMDQEVVLFTELFVYNESGVRGYVDIVFLGHMENDPEWEFNEKSETEFSKDLDNQVDNIFGDNINFVFDKTSGILTIKDTVEATTSDKIDFITLFISKLEGVKSISIGNLDKFTLTDDLNDLHKYLASYFNANEKLRLSSVKDFVAITLYDENDEGVDYILEFVQVDEIDEEEPGLVPDEKPDPKPEEKPKEEDKNEVESTPPTGAYLSTNYYLLLLSVSAALLLVVKKKKLFN